MKEHKDFRYRVMRSTYFEPKSTESLAEVVHAWGDPFKMPTVYAHMQRHQYKDLIKSQLEHKEQVMRGKSFTDPKFPEVVKAIEGTVQSIQPHEQGLDEFIRAGRAKLLAGEMPISATSYLSAVKIKAEIEKNTKDRRLEGVKMMFSGITGKNETKSSPEG